MESASTLFSLLFKLAGRYFHNGLCFFFLLWVKKEKRTLREGNQAQSFVPAGADWQRVWFIICCSLLLPALKFGRFRVTFISRCSITHVVRISAVPAKYCKILGTRFQSNLEITYFHCALRERGTCSPHSLKKAELQSGSTNSEHSLSWYL